MDQNLRLILDVGKTYAKASLWSSDGRLLDKASRQNARPTAPLGYPALDVGGIEAFFADVIAGFTRRGVVTEAVPVAHGAAAVLVADDGSWLAPLDYETELPDDLRQAYRKERDRFALTGSPSLPCGLNLGAQLYWLQAMAPDAFARHTIVTWPQFWSWRLTGVAATEVTSFGCHTDLWQPGLGCPSPMAMRRGWAARFAPLRGAGDVLGTVNKQWQQRCGLSADCQVRCGIHDSNAALLAMRGFREIAEAEHTVLSTGTWFIAMHATRGRQALDLAALPEARDCLVNVDAAGAPVPSARFMGGREAEILEAAPERQIDAAKTPELLAAAEKAVSDGVFILPTFQPGVGPYPQRQGTWVNRPQDQLTRRAATDLYLALITATMLNLIGSRGPLVVEGRFSGDPLFLGALASLRPAQPVFAAPCAADVSYGALRLITPDLPPCEPLAAVKPLAFDLAKYAARWAELAA